LYFVGCLTGSYRDKRKSCRCLCAFFRAPHRAFITTSADEHLFEAYDYELCTLVWSGELDMHVKGRANTPLYKQAGKSR
jgi:hypothetical protein